MRVLFCAYSLRGLDGVGAHLETTASQLLRRGADVSVLALDKAHKRDADPKTAFLLPALLASRGCTLIPPSRVKSIRDEPWDFCVGYSCEASNVLGESLPDTAKLFVYLDPGAAIGAPVYRNSINIGATEEVCAALLKARQMPPERVRLLRVPVDGKRFRYLHPPRSQPARILVIGKMLCMDAMKEYAEREGIKVAVIGPDAGQVPARCFRIRTPWRAVKTGVCRARQVEYNLEGAMQFSDLVVATGRAAYEAMFCGRPVFVCGLGRLGECIIRDQAAFARLIGTNCSGRYLRKTFSTANEIAEEMQGYSPSLGPQMRKWAKKLFDAETVVDGMLEMVKEAIDGA